jgi:PAS domain S-box-containing protein
VIVAFIVVIIFVLSVFTLFGVIREGQKEKRSLSEQGDMLAGIVARNSVIGVYSENRRVLDDVTDSIFNLKNVVAISIYNADLKVLYAQTKYPNGDENIFIPVNAVSELRTEESLSVGETAKDFEFIKPVMLHSTAKKDETLYFGGPPTDKADKVIGYVRIVLSKDTYRQRVVTIMRENTVIMAIFIASSTVIVYFFVRRLTHPLAKLTDNVKALEKGLHVEPVPVASRDEIGNLASAFNAMVRVREKAEQSLRESEERYRKLVEISPDGVYVLKNGEVVFTNAAGAVLLGAENSSQVLGRHMNDFVYEDDRDVIEKICSQVEEKKINIPYVQVRYRRPNDTAVDAEAAAAPFVFSGQPAVLVIARDVTQRKGMEDKIRNYQRELYTAATEMSTLESRVEERERYLIAADLHDFVGQNLVFLQLKLGLLLRALSDPAMVRHVEEIREIIGKTIEYTRSLTVELNPPILVEIGFKAAVESLAEAFQKTYGLSIRVKDDGQPIEIESQNRYLLFRCVREILMNVVKHAQADKVEIAMSRSADRIYVTVADNGAGFDMSTMDGKRTGFGLFTIRERMKRLGGYCEIDSKPGSGTTVILAMPVQ